MDAAVKLRRVAVKYSPARLLGAFQRRTIDIRRAAKYWAYRLQPIRLVALFESFQGKVIGDNPYYIYRELISQNHSVPIFWTIREGVTTAPERSTGVIHGTAQWAQALATSKYLVNNTNFPWYFRKRKSQVYLQTWHGTPLKKLMRDIQDSRPNIGYLRTMEREAASWDYLISPSAFCSEIFPRIFKYSGVLLECGYPRNDELVTATAQRRQEIRESLGITNPDKQVILYCPTWRDYQRLPDGRWASVTYIDDKISLPENSVLLFRGHTNTHDVHNSELAGKAIDVTKYPNVTELYIAADVLVTDYSSVMFDFAVTKKPIIFLTVDFDTYERERGFYFDFRNEAPGPIVFTQKDLEVALQNIDTDALSYRSKYQSWNLKFNDWEKGTSAKRVVDAVFGEI